MSSVLLTRVGIKKEKDRKEKIKGHGPEHVYNTLGYILLEWLYIYFGIRSTLVLPQ